MEPENEWTWSLPLVKSHFPGGWCLLQVCAFARILQVNVGMLPRLTCIRHVHGWNPAKTWKKCNTKHVQNPLPYGGPVNMYTIYAIYLKVVSYRLWLGSSEIQYSMDDLIVYINLQTVFLILLLPSKTPKCTPTNANVEPLLFKLFLDCTWVFLANFTVAGQEQTNRVVVFSPGRPAAVSGKDSASSNKSPKASSGSVAVLDTIRMWSLFLGAENFND